MAARASAGLLLYRDEGGQPEVLLVHPGGPFWASRDAGAWSIPKGEIGPGEDWLAAAVREFVEELGSAPQATGTPVALEPVRQRSGKVVHAWAQQGEFDPTGLRSNTFELEWPPRSGRMQEFPEVDRAAWFKLQEARIRLLEGQQPLIDQLQRILGTRSGKG